MGPLCHATLCIARGSDNLGKPPQGRRERSVLFSLIVPTPTVICLPEEFQMRYCLFSYEEGAVRDGTDVRVLKIENMILGVR